MLTSQLGEITKNRRKELKITQLHLVELAKVSTNSVYKLERGQGNPSFEVLNQLPVKNAEYLLLPKDLNR